MRKGITLILLILMGCIDPYTPAVITTNPDFLVVDGSYDPVNGTGTVILTRTLALSEDEETEFPAEPGATVMLQDESGATITTFHEVSPGTYQAQDGISLNLNSPYRLSILTADGASYRSALVTPRVAPAIDSITWSGDAEGVRIMANTHDDSGNTRYYRWIFEETWEYTSAFKSIVEWQGGTVIPRNEDIYTCWRTRSSTAILIESTVALETDIVANKEIHFIRKGAQELGIQYSILVKQQSIDKKTYEFWDLLKKTTEQIGGFFDPQPFVVKGNIEKLSGSKSAIGLFHISTTEEQRLSFGYDDLPLETKQRVQFTDCELTILLNAGVPDYSGSDLMVSLYNVGDVTLGYFKSSPRCVDCRVQGGVNQKPPYWE
jgi:hypothetical protein